MTSTSESRADRSLVCAAPGQIVQYVADQRATETEDTQWSSI
jgi:hypothetical protein